MLRLSLMLGLVLALLSTGFAFPAWQTKPKLENPVPKEKWNCKFYEEQYKVKLTAVTFNEGSSYGNLKEGVASHHFILTLEFTEDDTEGKVKSEKEGGKPLAGEVYFFDEENVVVGRGGYCRYDSEITRKKGDAFRFVVNVLAPNRITAAKRAEVREK